MQKMDEFGGGQQKKKPGKGNLKCALVKSQRLKGEI